MKEQLIEKIVELEWQQFQKVQNEGGRASCQDNRPTFNIMRTSQFLVWEMEILESYYQDLQDADAKGWNLLTEKYARMMESTAPVQYEQLKETKGMEGEEKVKYFDFQDVVNYLIREVTIELVPSDRKLIDFLFVDFLLQVHYYNTPRSHVSLLKFQLFSEVHLTSLQFPLSDILFLQELISYASFHFQH